LINGTIVKKLPSAPISEKLSATVLLKPGTAVPILGIACCQVSFLLIRLSGINHPFLGG
jgi:hypothetical protein